MGVISRYLPTSYPTSLVPVLVQGLQLSSEMARTWDDRMLVVVDVVERRKVAINSINQQLTISWAGR